MITVVRLGYIEPTKFYVLRESKDGELELTKTHEIKQATLNEISERLLPDQTILMDSAEPLAVATLRKQGHNIIVGRL